MIFIHYYKGEYKIILLEVYLQTEWPSLDMYTNRVLGNYFSRISSMWQLSNADNMVKAFGSWFQNQQSPQKGHFGTIISKISSQVPFMTSLVM